MGMALYNAGGKVGKQDEIDVGQREPNANVTQRVHTPPARIGACVVLVCITMPMLCPMLESYAKVGTHI